MSNTDKDADEDLADELLIQAEELCHICNEALDPTLVWARDRQFCCGVACHSTCLQNTIHTNDPKLQVQIISGEKCFHCKKKKGSESTRFSRVLEWCEQGHLWAMVYMGTVNDKVFLIFLIVFVVFFFLELDGYFNMMDTSMMDMMDMMPYFHLFVLSLVLLYTSSNV